MMSGLRTRTRGSVLAVPGFARLWLCSTTDAWAVSLLPVAVTLALVRRGDSATALGLVLAAKTLGFVLATVPGGVAADRWSRSSTVFLACLVRVASTGMLLLWLNGPMWVIAACVFVTGAGEGVLRPSYQALIGDLVPEPQRQSANALSTVTFRLALVLSPGAATALTLWSGPRTVLATTILLWLCAAYVVRGLPRLRAPDRSAETVLQGFLSGIRAARGQPWFLAGLVILTLVLGVGEATQMVLLPVISRDRFGTDAVYAVALTMFALGALAGGVVMLRWRSRRPGLFAVTGITLFAGIPFTLAFSTAAWPVFVAHFAAGLGMEMFNVSWFSAIQREFPPAMRARISSLDFLVSYALSPLSLAILPAAVAGVGTRPALICTGAMMAIVSLCSLTIPGMANFRTPRRGSPRTEPPRRALHHTPGPGREVRDSAPAPAKGRRPTPPGQQ
ncbi:MFS transporter [Streptomyces sp. CC224B]|uniref:MFS transporter n=1 Tax=Streptomyces sp. CC224B TaxID=3044571 RepID=UPI0024A88873|nr:MFS transporter [Streptomyces sp. CC224B]